MKDDRDIEKGYSTSEFVSKLRRLADALESGDKFEILENGMRQSLSKFQFVSFGSP